MDGDIERDVSYMKNVIKDFQQDILKEKEFMEFVQELLADYEKLGPLPGILLPFIEAFLPFLPLFVFVLANGAAYGLFEGFLYSWIGASFGSLGVFLLFVS